MYQQPSNDRPAILIIGVVLGVVIGWLIRSKVDVEPVVRAEAIVTGKDVSTYKEIRP